MEKLDQLREVTAKVSYHYERIIELWQQLYQQSELIAICLLLSCIMLLLVIVLLIIKIMYYRKFKRILLLEIQKETSIIMRSSKPW